MVGIGEISRINLHLARIQFLFVRRQGVPLFQEIVRPRSEFCILRDDAQPLLVGEDLIARGIPAHVEFALELRNPFGRRVVRRVGAARCVIKEEGLIRGEFIELVHVVDGVVRHRSDQVPARLAHIGMDRGGVANEIARLPLVGFAAHEAVEIIEPHADGPLIEWTGLTGLERGRVVILAKPRGRVAVVLKDRADGRLVPGDDAVVAGITRRDFRDDAKTNRMVVAPGDQGRARRRAQCR